MKHKNDAIFNYLMQGQLGHLPEFVACFYAVKQQSKILTAKGKDYVFPVKGNGRSQNWIRRELIRIAKEAGIPKLTKVHTLRHTFASHLVMAGVDLPSIQKLMGHSDIETTMIYAHLASDHLANAIEKLSFA